MSALFRAARRAALAAAIAAAGIGWSLAPSPWSPVPAALAADTAWIAHAEDGLSLRAEPSFGAEVLATLANGTPVTLRTGRLDTVSDPDGSTRWWPVRTHAGDGWVSGFYLELSPVAEAASEPAPITASEAAIAAWKETAPAVIDGDGGWDLAGAAAASVSEPDGVNMRAEPGLAGAVLAALPGGALLDLRVGEAETVYADGSRWWPVRHGGVAGWVSGDFLEPASWASGATTPELAAPAPAAAAAPAFYGGDYVEVSTDDGEGLNIRADGAPDAERVGLAAEGDVIQVMDGPAIDPLGNPWYMVTDDGVTGWVFGAYLARADGPPAPEVSGASWDAAEDADDEDAADDSPFGDGFPFGDDHPFGEGFPFGDAGVATGSFMYPVADYVFTQGFGCTGFALEPWDSGLGCNFHNGIDLAANEWTPVYAADGGIVEQAGWCDCGLGYYVKIDHGNGFKTVYGHLVAYAVNPGDAVAKGERIASLGTTGNSTGSHLHFITQFNGVPYDPLWYLP